MAITVNIDTPPRISKSFTQTAHGCVVGDVLYRKFDNTWAKARSSTTEVGRALGYVSAVADVDNFTLTFQGYITTGVPVATAGTVFYVDPTTPGEITSTQPPRSVPVLVIIESGASAILLIGIDTQRMRQWLTGDVATVLAAGTTRYCFLWGSTGVPQVTEAFRQNVAMIGTYQYYTINTVTAQPGTGSLVLTSRVGGVDDNITITIAAGSAAAVFEDLTNIITVAGLNTLVGMKFVNNASGNSTQVISTRILYTEN